MEKNRVSKIFRALEPLYIRSMIHKKNVLLVSHTKLSIKNHAHGIPKTTIDQPFGGVMYGLHLSHIQGIPYICFCPSL